MSPLKSTAIAACAFLAIITMGFFILFAQGGHWGTKEAGDIMVVANSVGCFVFTFVFCAAMSGKK